MVDVGALAGLPVLQHLRRANSKVADVSPLGQIATLVYLDLRANPLGLDGLEALPGLLELSIEQTGLAADPLSTWSNAIAGHEALERVYVWDNAITSLAPLVDAPGWSTTAPRSRSS